MLWDEPMTVLHIKKLITEMIEVGYPNAQDIERPNPKDLSSHFLKRTLAALASRIQLPIALIAALLGDDINNAALYIRNYQVVVRV